MTVYSTRLLRVITLCEPIWLQRNTDLEHLKGSTRGVMIMVLLQLGGRFLSAARTYERGLRSSNHHKSQFIDSFQ